MSGGSEAVEAALKLARQYFLEIGQPQRHRVIARLQSYHGNTLGALAAGGNMWRREPFAPLMIDTSHISPCYAYRGITDKESDFDYGQRVANELETEINRLGAERVMAFVAEPVVGATMGAVPAVKGYFTRIREICDQYGVLLILDEVMCGMGRTGSLFACEQESIVPDITTIAKGLEERGIELRSLTERIDTTTAGGRLIFNVFAAVAQFERDIISERTKAGLKAARARGHRGGHKPKVDDKMLKAADAMLGDPTVTMEDVALTLNVSRAAIYRAYQRRNLVDKLKKDRATAKRIKREFQQT